MKLQELLAALKDENINTWFDLGLFLDRLKEDPPVPHKAMEESFHDFQEKLKKGGVGLLTFHYMVDGVTVEAEKYASLLRRNLPGAPIHYIAGKINNKTVPFIHTKHKQKVIRELAGFDDWDLYGDFYFTKLQRGSRAYNELILKLWQQTLCIVEKLGAYLEEEGIELLFLINVCSNPGNVAFALASVLLSEYLGIPVINNNHDFYWEGGACKTDREKEGSKQGPRDFFFTNYHLGEVFSVLEVLFPWQSKSWIQVNINKGQSEYLIQQKGHNPAHVMEIGTAVDTAHYTKSDKRKNINTFLQLEKILSRYQKRLVSYSVDDVLKRNLVAMQDPRPILIGAKTLAVNRFISENIILLQPTRIISRKWIESSFSLLLKMFQDEALLLRFKRTAHLKMTLLITGPIANGHYGYLLKLVKKFGALLQEAAPELKDRIYLALLFGELDKERFKEKFSQAAGIAELYNISSLVLLPSKTEGRGLPIIEATACGTPIFCRRFEPETVYSAVIGENLEEKDRLKVLEFKGKRISNGMVERITDRVFFPHRYTDEVKHNQRVVNKRYSLDALNINIKQIINRVYTQLKSREKAFEIMKEKLGEFQAMVNSNNEHLEALLDTQNRQYIAGYYKLEFMSMLKSLIDPSYFRVEEQRIRGMAYGFAGAIINNDMDAEQIPEELLLRFYNAMASLFEYRKGEHPIQHDHAMSYRHRNRYRYPYQDFTFQELTGLINLLYMKIVQARPQNKVDLSPQFFTDWSLALLQLTGSPVLAIDDRKRLIERLRKNQPIAYFPGAYIMYELEFFALQSIRARMRLPLEEVITREMLENEDVQVQPVYIFAQEKNLGKQLNKDEITDYILHGASVELKLLYEHKLIQIVRTRQVCVGIHFPQLGEEALKTLRSIRERNGYILTNRSNASMMTDMVDMDRFHIGIVSNEFTAHCMGIPKDSGYIQFVPAGVRSTLAYPSPIQTAKDFEKVLKSELFQRMVKKLGEKEVFSLIRKEASLRGSPIKYVLEKLDKGEGTKGPLSYEYLSGLYHDGMPYQGVVATLTYKKEAWDFAALTSQKKPKTVQRFVKEFEKLSGRQAQIAWNGGYILNPELVGKLGISEDYVGSPLGLFIADGLLSSVPLFNKPALLVYQDGSIDIKRVNSSAGLRVEWRSSTIRLDSDAYLRKSPAEGTAYFDLLHDQEFIEGHGRVIVRLSGRRVMEIIKTKKGERVPVLPVGLSLALEPELLPAGARQGDLLSIRLNGYEDIKHAIEAGPMLLDNGQLAVDMKAEGWDKAHSIRSQAARLDYTDMRGPKIAVGINQKGEMAVLAINGRIRESVGATHKDMAEILKQLGMEKAMGFDPGGSSTLVVGGTSLNISPYHRNYERDIYALPPEARAVSNAIIGYINN